MNKNTTNNIIKHLICIFFISINLNLLSQNGIPIKTGVIIEKIGLLDFQKKGDRYGFGFNIGSELNYLKKSKLDLNQTIDYYYYTHEKYGISSVFATLFNFRFKSKRLSIDTKIGPGYILFYNYTSVYKKTSEGYEKTSNFQNKFSAIGSLGVSYKIKDIKPYIAYNILVETPFINSSSRILPHQLLEVGIYFNFKKQKNEN